MNTIQILALLAMVSMAIPATFAVRYWQERNYYLDELYNADQLYYKLLRKHEDLQDNRDFYRKLAFDACGHDNEYNECHCSDCETLDIANLDCPF